jgi:mono/diheme cytochrome c family protein
MKGLLRWIGREASSEVGSLGRYLARTTCGACHGSDLRGAPNPDFTSPSLQIVAGYSAEAFSALMRTGVALGERQLPVMSPQARLNPTNLTDAEITALYSYLHVLPDAVSH